jgi:hypothetical protein
MIKQETAGKIWTAYREIEAANKLLDDMAKAQKERHVNDDIPTLQDAFGNYCNLQLGVPCASNGHRLFNVAPVLARTIIEAHIAEKRAELKTLNAQAGFELNTDQPGAV